MFDTNTLLSIAFSVISNFAQTVEIPAEWIPRQASDLQCCRIGGPSSSIQMNLIHKAGTQFWIDHGVVEGFASPDAYSRLQDPAHLKHFAGETGLNSNDVVQVAYKALKPLIKHGTPLSDGPPRVQYSEFFEGKRIPFFTVLWPKTSPGSEIAAKVEIDGRNGRIVALNVWGPGFYDEAFEQQIKQRVNAPVRPKTIRRPDHASWPKPSTNYVAEAIGRWLFFCANIGLAHGEQTGLADVDWEQTFLYPRGIQGNSLQGSSPCWIQFKSGCGFGSYDGFTFSHYGPDVAFPARGGTGLYTAWERFEGDSTYDWRILAAALEAKLIEHLRIPKTDFEKAQPKQRSPQFIRVGHPLRRVQVMWTQPRPERYLGQEAEEVACFLRAEFDLQTGDTKSVAFNLWPSHDPGIFRLLREAANQARP